MARFLSGPDALRHSLHEDKVSTVFAASTRGVRIVIYQKPDGSTTWRIDDEVDIEEECLSLFSDSMAFYLRLGDLATGFPFTDVVDFQSNYEFYTIDRVEVSMYTASPLTSNTFAADNMLVAANPLIVYAVDRRNSNPDNMEALLVDEHVQMKQLDINSPIEVSYTPSASFNLGNINGPTATRAMIEYSPKLSVLATQVDHFGVKFACFGMNVKPETDRACAVVSIIVKQYVTFYQQRVKVV